MELLGDPVYQPMRFREIAGHLRLSKDEKKDLYRVLDDLVAEGRLTWIPRDVIPK